MSNLRVVLLAALVLWTSPAAAQSAKDLYEQGMAALNAGRYTEAVEKLDGSYRLNQVPVVLYNLGVAYSGMGRPEKAVEAYEAYVGFADKKTEAQNIAQVQAEIDRLRANNARFSLNLTPPDAEIRIDGKKVKTFKDELWMTPGRHTIAIAAPEHEDYQQVLEIQAGHYNLDIKLRAATGPPSERAGRYLAEGNALKIQGDLAGAIAKYEAAQRIYPTPEAQGQLGLTQEAHGALADAEYNVKAALKARRDPWVRKNRRPLNQAKSRLRRELGTLDIKGSPTGAEIFVNDRPVGALPLAGVVRAKGGYVVVTATKEGYEDFRTDVELRKKGRKQVIIEMAEAQIPAGAMLGGAAVLGGAAGLAAAGTGAGAAPPVAANAQALSAAEAAAAEAAAAEAAAAEAAAAEAAAAEAAAAAAAADQLAAEQASQSDIEAQTEADARKYGEFPDEHPKAEGFEMAINGGYQHYFGDNTPPAASPVFVGTPLQGAADLEIMLGARYPWFISYGIMLNGGFSLGDDYNHGNLNPGLYVRGHLQKDKRKVWYDAFVGLGVTPIGMQAAILKQQPIDPATVDPTTIDPNTTQADLAANQLGIDRGVTLQSVNLNVDFGGVFWITESFGINLTMGFDFLFPTQACLRDSDDTLCFSSDLPKYKSFNIGGGISLLP